MRHRHAEYYLQLVESADLDQLAWLDRMQQELESLRAAMAWCLEASESTDRQAVDPGLRLAGGMHWFWLFRDHHEEGLAWLEQMLARSTAVDTVARARALGSAGVLAGLVGDLARSRDLLNQSIQLCRDLDDGPDLSRYFAVLGSTPWGSDGEQHATSALKESLIVARATGEPSLIGHALLHAVFRVVNSTGISRPDERAHARACGHEGLQCLRSASDTRGAAVMQLSLGRVALYDGDCVGEVGIPGQSAGVAQAGLAVDGG